MPEIAPIPTSTSHTPIKPSTEEELKRLNAHLGAGFNKKQADKVFMNKENEDIVLTESEIDSKDSIYIKNCNSSSFRIEAMCTKIFVESCTNLDLILRGRVLTSTLEIWKCKNVKTEIKTPIQTLQIDLCDSVCFTFEKSAGFNRLVWSVTENLEVKFGDIDQGLRTGSTEMANGNSRINKETDQFIVRLFPSKLNPTQLVLRNELVVRLENGFPTTEREARQFEERQEANLQKLAGEILGKDILIGKKKESVKIGRNEPCICGSSKKYKKCCGTDSI